MSIYLLFVSYILLNIFFYFKVLKRGYLLILFQGSYSRIRCFLASLLTSAKIVMLFCARIFFLVLV